MEKYAILCSEPHPFHESRENLRQGKSRNDLAALVYFYTLRVLLRERPLKKEREIHGEIKFVGKYSFKAQRTRFPIGL